MLSLLSVNRLVTPIVIMMTLATSAQAETVLRRANDLSFGGSESLDPISANRFYEVNDLIYSRLIRQGDDGRPAPELAQTWTANATATEWTLTLQPGVTFHDGSAFDAADVKFQQDKEQVLERISELNRRSTVKTDLLKNVNRPTFKVKYKSKT
jgi:peptide/nickel transport system substrate-binding protein